MGSTVLRGDAWPVAPAAGRGWRSGQGVRDRRGPHRCGGHERSNGGPLPASDPGLCRRSRDRRALRRPLGSDLHPPGRRFVGPTMCHAARAFCEIFVADYNHERRHSGIGLHTPASVHYGTATEIRAERARTLDADGAANETGLFRRARATRRGGEAGATDPRWCRPGRGSWGSGTSPVPDPPCTPLP